MGSSVVEEVCSVIIYEFCNCGYAVNKYMYICLWGRPVAG